MSKMLKLHLLSRAREFTATHGMTEEYKDYISIVKNQGDLNLCWAYSLTSAIEMKHALVSGNRLMLDPLTLSNNSVNWWKRHPKTPGYDICDHYSGDDNNAYPQVCAVDFMLNSKQTMIFADGNDSFVYIRDAGIINSDLTVQSLYDQFDKHKLFYAGIDSVNLGEGAQIDDYIKGSGITHAVVITAIGYIDNPSYGLYLEVLNSWGYDVHHDGLVYIKVADNEQSVLHDNLNILESMIWIDVDKSVDSTITIISITFIAVSFVLIVIDLILFTLLLKYSKECSDSCCFCSYCFIKRKYNHQHDDTDDVVKV